MFSVFSQNSLTNRIGFRTNDREPNCRLCWINEVENYKYRWSISHIASQRIELYYYYMNINTTSYAVDYSLSGAIMFMFNHVHYHCYYYDVNRIATAHGMCSVQHPSRVFARTRSMRLPTPSFPFELLISMRFKCTVDIIFTTSNYHRQRTAHYSHSTRIRWRQRWYAIMKNSSFPVHTKWGVFVGTFSPASNRFELCPFERVLCVSFVSLRVWCSLAALGLRRPYLHNIAACDSISNNFIRPSDWCLTHGILLCCHMICHHILSPVAPMVNHERLT